MPENNTVGFEQVLEQLNISYNNGHYYQRGFRIQDLRGPSVSRSYVLERAKRADSNLGIVVEQYYNSLEQQKAEAKRNKADYCTVLAEMYNRQNNASATNEEIREALDAMKIRAAKTGRNYYDVSAGKARSLKRGYVAEKLNEYFAQRQEDATQAVAQFQRTLADLERSPAFTPLARYMATQGDVPRGQETILPKPLSLEGLARGSDAANSNRIVPLDEALRGPHESNKGRRLMGGALAALASVVIAGYFAISLAGEAIGVRGARKERTVAAQKAGNPRQAIKPVKAEAVTEAAAPEEQDAGEILPIAARQKRYEADGWGLVQADKGSAPEKKLEAELPSGFKRYDGAEALPAGFTGYKAGADDSVSAAKGSAPASGLEAELPSGFKRYDKGGILPAGFQKYDSGEELPQGFTRYNGDDSLPRGFKKYDGAVEPAKDRPGIAMRVLGAIGDDLNQYRKNAAGITGNPDVDEQSVHRRARDNLQDLVNRPGGSWNRLKNIASSRTADGEKKGVYEYTLGNLGNLLSAATNITVGPATDVVGAGINAITPANKVVEGIADPLLRTPLYLARRLGGGCPNGNSAFGDVTNAEVLSELAERAGIKAQDSRTSFDVNGDGTTTTADIVMGSIPVVSQFRDDAQEHRPVIQKVTETAGYAGIFFGATKVGEGAGGAAKGGGHTRRGGEVGGGSVTGSIRLGGAVQ